MLQKNLVIISALLMLLCVKSSAQCDTSSFAPDSLQIITYGGVRTMKKYQDTLYVGGSFTMIGKYTGSFIGIDTLTGKPANQPTWPKSNGDVLDVVPDGSGGWVIVGDFTMAGDNKRTNVAQINSSGQVTTLSITVNGVVNVALVHNGVLYIGGTFSAVNGNTRNHAAAINLTTGVLTTWDPNCNGDINALATDGSDIYIGGAFTNVGGNIRTRIAAVDATTGVVTSWAPAGVSNNAVLTIVIKNNKVYIGGSFTSPTNRLRAFDKITGSSISWNPNSSGIVRDMVLIRNLLYVAGDFSTINSVTRYDLAAIDTLTGMPNAWNPTNTGVTSVECLTSNGSNIYVGGGQRVAIIDTATAVTKAISPNVGGVVYTVASAGDKVFAGGDFSGLGLTKRSYLTGINMKDWSILPLTLNVQDAFSYATIHDIEIDNGKIYIGGDFDFVNGNNRNHVASLDITNNYSLLAFNPLAGISINGGINDMVIYGPHLYVVGDGTFFARKTDKISGAIDASWSLGSYYAYSDVNAIKVVGNDLFMGGYIKSSSTTYGFLKHNVSTGVNTAYNFGNPVKNFGADVNKVYCTGTFYGQPLASPMFLESLNINPLNDNLWHPNPNLYVQAIEVDKGRVYVGGSGLNGFGSIPRDGLAITDTITGRILGGWHPGVTSGEALGFLPLGDTLYVYGTQGTIGGKRISNITRFHFNYGKPVVTVASANGYVCASTNTTFTATVAPTTSVSSYKWKKNGVDVGTNSLYYAYTPVNGDVLTCTVTFSGCYIDNQASSAPYTVTTTPNAPLNVSITATANPVCTGTSVTYTATSNVGGVSYQWYKWPNPISGATNSTYTYIPQNGNDIECRVTATGCYTPTQAISNTIAMTVNNYSPGTSLISVANNPICQGTNASFSANTSMNSNGNPNFQWKVNGANIGTNSSLFSYIANNNDQVVCEVTATTGCYNPSVVTSSPIAMNVTPTITPTINIMGNSIPQCEGTQVIYTATGIPIGSTYQWKVNGSNVGSNTATYVYPPSIGDIISCALTASSGCLTSPNATSNTLTPNLITKLTPTISLNAVPMAGPGATVTVSATVANAGNNYTIDWINNNNIFSTTTAPVTTYIKGPGIDNISAAITPQGCYNKATSAPIIVQISTSVQEALLARGISVSPNPFLGQLVVKGLNKGDRLYLYDAMGRKTGHDFTINETNKEQTLGVNDIMPGIYMLYITDGVTKEMIGAITLQKQ